MRPLTDMWLILTLAIVISIV